MDTTLYAGKIHYKIHSISGEIHSISITRAVYSNGSYYLENKVVEFLNDIKSGDAEFVS